MATIKPISFNAEMNFAVRENRKTEVRLVVKFPAGYNPRWTGYIPDGPVLYGSNNIPAVKAPYQPGDILYVRETWYKDSVRYMYRTDYSDKEKFYVDGRETRIKWHPSIHMPKTAARTFLRVTNVRVERLQDISVYGALKEGTPDIDLAPICKNGPIYPNGFEGWTEEKQDEWFSNAARFTYIGWCDYADRLLKEYARIWNSYYAKPRPVRENGVIVRYESYPWEATSETRTYRGLPWHVIGNPYVWDIQFEKCDKPEGWPLCGEAASTH